VENARVVGDAFRVQLETFVDRYPFVGEVRGRGLFLAIELVRDRKTREPLDPSVTQAIFDACLARGLLTMSYDARVRIQPALTIDTATVTSGVAVLREVFDKVHAQRLWEANAPRLSLRIEP